jgi:hypothetical protein
MIFNFDTFHYGTRYLPSSDADPWHFDTDPDADQDPRIRMRIREAQKLKYLFYI